jgi:uncharacterized protein with PIN domain
MKRNKITITAKQILNMERTARRNVDIELGISRPTNKAHKNAKDYTRKPKHKKALNLGD